MGWGFDLIVSAKTSKIPVSTTVYNGLVCYGGSKQSKHNIFDIMCYAD